MLLQLELFIRFYRCFLKLLCPMCLRIDYSQYTTLHKVVCSHTTYIYIFLILYDLTMLDSFFLVCGSSHFKVVMFSCRYSLLCESKLHNEKTCVFVTQSFKWEPNTILPCLQAALEFHYTCNSLVCPFIRLPSDYSTFDLCVPHGNAVIETGIDGIGRISS